MWRCVNLRTDKGDRRTDGGKRPVSFKYHVLNSLKEEVINSLTSEYFSYSLEFYDELG